MERYEIIITEKEGKVKTNVSGVEESQRKTNIAGQDDKKAKDVKQSKDAIASVIAKTVINEARALVIPRIGEFARDSLLQQKIDASLNLADTAVSFAINPIVGIANLGNKMASSALDFGIRYQKEQERLTVQLQRASYVNRSRD